MVLCVMSLAGPGFWCFVVILFWTNISCYTWWLCSEKPLQCTAESSTHFSNIGSVMILIIKVPAQNKGSTWVVGRLFKYRPIRWHLYCTNTQQSVHLNPKASVVLPFLLMFWLPEIHRWVTGFTWEIDQMFSLNSWIRIGSWSFGGENFSQLYSKCKNGECFRLKDY